MQPYFDQTRKTNSKNSKLTLLQMFTGVYFKVYTHTHTQVHQCQTHVYIFLSIDGVAININFSQMQDQIRL